MPPSRLAKELEAQIRRSLRNIDMAKADKKIKDLIAELMQVLNDAKTYVHDYELSETREEQLNNAKRAKHFLERAGKDVLSLSEHGFFSAIDVAHISAQIDTISTALR